MWGCGSSQFEAEATEFLMPGDHTGGDWEAEPGLEPKPSKASAFAHSGRAEGHQVEKKDTELSSGQSGGWWLGRQDVPVEVLRALEGLVPGTVG